MRTIATLVILLLSWRADAGTVTAITVTGRDAWVYTPAGYAAGRSYPLLVCFDGAEYKDPAGVGVPAILDALIAAKRLPPMIAVFVGQTAARNVELSNNATFLAYVTDKLLPAVRARWSATSDPRQTAACGTSAGGLASAFAAFRRPDVFGNVLSQSGAFWLGPTRDSTDYEWLTHQYATAPRRAVRFVLQIGRDETHPTQSGASKLDVNRRLRAALERAGYEVHYREVPNGHDETSLRASLGDGLIELFGLSSP